MFASTLLLLFALLLTASHASHVVCSWRPWKDSPEKHGFRAFCQAQLLNTSANTGPISAEYRCGWPREGDVGAHDVKVGDWSWLRTDILELATPCNGGGYGFDSEGDCYGKYWSVCLGLSSDGECYYLAYYDDCEWPDKVTAEDHLHKYIDVWYHIGDFNDTEKRAGVGTGVRTGAVAVE